MAKIRIIGRPLGRAPEWARDEWIGLELPTFNITIYTIDVQSKEDNHWYTSQCPAYCVNVKAALEILKKNSPKAAEWWEERKSIQNQINNLFYFESTVCTLL